MKKTQKKILGFFGLGVVVAMTSVALTLPNPGVSAVSSVTDTVVVVVRSDTPDVNIDGLEPGEVITEPEKTIDIDYSYVDTLKVVLKYTSRGGVVKEFTLTDGPTSDLPNPLPISINFENPEYGYGDYELTVTGEGFDGIKDIDVKNFSYAEFAANLDENEDTDETYVDLKYKADDGSEAGDGNVATIVLNVYGPDGNIVSELSPITVAAPNKRVRIPFEDYELDPGVYTIKITAYDREGEALFNRELSKRLEEEIPVPDTNAPDTGGLFRNIGISQSDFLITGLIMFFVAGFAGLYIIGKRNKKSSKR